MGKLVEKGHWHLTKNSTKRPVSISGFAGSGEKSNPQAILGAYTEASMKDPTPQRRLGKRTRS